MRKYRVGELGAFEELYGRHANRVYGYLRRKLPESSVDDTFQEVWMKLHRSRDRYDESFPFLPWLYTLVRNVMIDRLRTLRRSVEIPTDIECSNAEQVEGPGAPAYGEVLASLAAGEKQIVSMHYELGLSFNEIAKRLRIQPAAARKTSSRAIQKLRALFGAKS